MEKNEFEQKFLEKLKQKTWSKSPRNNDLQENLKNYLKFIDEHKIYEYVPYENILKKIDDTEFKEDEHGILRLSNALAFYDQELERVVFSSKKNGKHNRNFSSTVIHELTHALSAQVNKTFDREIFEKGYTTQVFSQLPIDIYKKLFYPEEFEFSLDEFEDIFEGELEDIFEDEEIQSEDFVTDEFDEAKTPLGGGRRDKFLELLDLSEEDEQKVQQHRLKHPFFIAALNPVGFDFDTGLSHATIEYNKSVSSKKMRQFYSSMYDYLKYALLEFVPQSLCDFDKFGTSNNMTAANEGITDFIASLIDAKSNLEGLTDVSWNGYDNLIMLTAQLHCVFGENMFEAYFSNSTRPMSKKLDLNDKDFFDFLESFSEITQNEEEDEDEETQVDKKDNSIDFSLQHKINDKQIYIAKLLERKILRELAKNSDKFTSPKYMHFAIESAFIDFSKHLIFGKYLPSTDFDWERVYDQMEKSLQNCIDFGNKLLKRQNLPNMPKMSHDIRQQFIEETYANYYYVGKNSKEITLTNRLVPYERENLAPTQKSLYSNRWKNIKFNRKRIRPGEIFYNVANGADPNEWKDFILSDKFVPLQQIYTDKK